jgi:DNA-binding response OmpR family regulator
MDKPCKVLLLEDNGDDIFFVQQATKELKITNPLIIVRDGQEAMDYLRGVGAYEDRERYPVPTHALLDLKVPRKSGLQLLAWMRSEPAWSKLRVIVFTSSRDRADIDAARALGIDAYLVKPVAFRELVSTIEAIRLYWGNHDKRAIAALDTH